MKKEFTAEELKKALASITQNNAPERELSLDELESVSGGWSYSDNGGDMINVNLTNEEYDLLKPLLDLSIAKSIIAQYGLEDFSLEKTMTLPREKGLIVVNLLTTFLSEQSQ